MNMQYVLTRVNACSENASLNDALTIKRLLFSPSSVLVVVSGVNDGDSSGG